jgi:hypothetical protein
MRPTSRASASGNARVTVVSKRTETRYTFRIAAPSKDGSVQYDEPLRFVSLLTGADNDADFTYLGLIPDRGDPAFRTTKGSRMPVSSAPMKAARFLCDRVIAHPEAPIPADLEIWHEGRCGKCGRTLTVPESIEHGFGPECWAKLGG